MSPHTFIALQCNHDILIGHLSETGILEHTHWFVIIFGGFPLAKYYFRRHLIFDGNFVFEKKTVSNASGGTRVLYGKFPLTAPRISSTSR